MEKAELTKWIKAEAIDMGFDKVGIAKAEKVQSERFLQEWLQSGYHATMNWMSDRLEERLDPCSFYPAARSVISLALNYYTPEPVSIDPQTAKISRYAWGDDYHTIVKNMLKSLLDRIKGLDRTIEGVCCVDTSPVMDKYWAAKAGIGWQGKHSNVITKELGSWVFLGEILLNTELDYDTPIGDFCGTCNRCVEACPTQAITKPYVVDSRRCISYWTIEYRGDNFPSNEWTFDNWIFGCDICQDVCPWNKKFSKTTNVQAFFPREINTHKKAEEWLGLTEEEFSKRFKNSPVKRVKFGGFMRNVRHIMQKIFGNG